jgi:hypothetical protein
MMHNQKDIIASWLRRPVSYLKKLKGQTLVWLNHDKRQLQLLQMYREDPKTYEEMVWDLMKKIEQGQWKVDVLTEVIRRK